MNKEIGNEHIFRRMAYIEQFFFGYLAFKFNCSPENLAIECLIFC